MKALIFVNSPLQLINIRSAIKHFNINKYDLFITVDETSNRHKQIEIMANLYGISYKTTNFYKDIITKRRFFYINFIKFCLTHKFGEYDILLLGDYRWSDLTISQLNKIKKGGRIIYVDDGNASINILKGRDITLNSKIIYYIANYFLKLKKIKNNIYFTAYYDVRSTRFDIIPNKSLELNIDNKRNDKIYFIGTNTKIYTEYLGISTNNFLNKLRNILNKIKEENPGKKIIYIPHGRDQVNDIKLICNDLNIEYSKIEICIELFLIEQNEAPYALYALGSSALFNLKQIFPNTLFKNIRTIGNNKKANNIYNELYSYYEKHGIQTIII